MNRRDALLALIALGTATHAPAQAGSRLPRVAIIDPSEPVADIAEGRSAYWGPLLEELRRLGHIEGRTVVIERWNGGGDIAGYASLARKVAEGQPQLIVERGRTMLVQVAAATTTIPIVTVGTIPVDLIGKLSRPVRNITGIQSSADEQQIYAKDLEFLQQLTKPNARIAWLGPRVIWESIVGEAARKGAVLAKLNLQPVFVSSPVNEQSIRDAFASTSNAKFDGMLVSPASEFNIHRKAIAELAAARRLPSMHSSGIFVEAGLLMTYGPDYPGLYRRAAHYVDRILKGAKPADLPIEQPTTFKLQINLKTARQIGLRIPESMILRADRVIE